MNIYIVAKDKIKNTNYFVDELADILRSIGHHVELGLDLFWSENIFLFDIIYFQWPEFIFKGEVTDADVQKLQDRIIEIKNHGLKILAHCHNLRPHTIDNTNKIKLYDIVYSNCNIMIHMGSYSKRLMQEMYPNIQHYIIPHHTYNAFKFEKDISICKKDLNLPSNKINILCFGQFRNKAERNLILRLKQTLPSKEYNFITPGFYRERLIQKDIFKSIKVCFKTLYYKLRGIKFSNKLISDDITEKLFCATDIVMIQRPQILNSGNLPMAFCAGKVVIGPDTGNVGTILKETGNPTYNPNDINSAINAIAQAIQMNLTGKGDENKLYAQRYWSHKQISNLFNNILSKLEYT